MAIHDSCLQPLHLVSKCNLLEFFHQQVNSNYMIKQLFPSQLNSRLPLSCIAAFRLTVTGICSFLVCIELHEEKEEKEEEEEEEEEDEEEEKEEEEVHGVLSRTSPGSKPTGLLTQCWLHLQLSATQNNLGVGRYLIRLTAPAS